MNKHTCNQHFTCRIKFFFEKKSFFLLRSWLIKKVFLSLQRIFLDQYHLFVVGGNQIQRKSSSLQSVLILLSDERIIQNDSGKAIGNIFSQVTINNHIPDNVLEILL